MAKDSKPANAPTYIKQWRKHRGLTQDQLADQIDIDQSTLGRIERGHIAYTQPVLESVAVALGCRPADLIMRPPSTIDVVEETLRGLSDEAQRRALAVIKALKEADRR